MKRNFHHRHKWEWVDLMQDGGSTHERIKGIVKKLMKRHTKKTLKRLAEQEMRENY